MARRDVMVSYESIRRWCLKFGPVYQKALRWRKPKGSERRHTDEIFMRINGEILYL